jgi:anti-sigma B factor antagonist
VTTKNIVVKEVPNQFTAGQAWSFFEEVKPLLKSQRPNVVFDFSHVIALDRSGILVLVKCFEEALKQNGDVKLAAVPEEMGYTLQQTGLDEICDIYETGQEAADSFYSEGWISQFPSNWSGRETLHSSGD